MIDLDDFNAEQREVVAEAITGGAPPEFARVIARPQLPAEEMKKIMGLIQKGKLGKLPIDFYVRPEFSADKMELMHEWINDTYDLELAETYADEQLKSHKSYFSSCTRAAFWGGVHRDLIHYTVSQYVEGKLTYAEMSQILSYYKLVRDLDFKQRAAIASADHSRIDETLYEIIANPKLKAEQMKELLCFAASKGKNAPDTFTEVFLKAEEMIRQNEMTKKISIRDKLDSFSSERPKKKLRYIRDKKEIARIPKELRYVPKERIGHSLER